MEIVDNVYTMTRDFPKNELYGMTSQIRRCVVSIPSNIAEGCSRSSDKELNRFLEISIGSSYELETQLLIAEKLNLSSKDFRIVLQKLNQLQRMINKFRTTLGRS